MAGPTRSPRERFAPRFDALEVRDLLSLAPALVGSTPATRARDLLVRFRADASPAVVAAVLGRLKATVVAAIPDGPSRVEPGPGLAPDAAIRALVASGAVAYAERDDATYRVAGTIPNDPRFVQQWGLRNPAGNGVDINALKAWAITTGGNPSTVVAVIDSGSTWPTPTWPASSGPTRAAASTAGTSSTIHRTSGTPRGTAPTSRGSSPRRATTASASRGSIGEPA